MAATRKPTPRRSAGAVAHAGPLRTSRAATVVVGAPHAAETPVDPLRRDFAAHGRRAIEVARTKHPINYLRLAASLLQRATPADDPSEMLSDEELRAAIPRLRH